MPGVTKPPVSAIVTGWQAQDKSMEGPRKWSLRLGACTSVLHFRDWHLFPMQVSDCPRVVESKPTAALLKFFASFSLKNKYRKQKERERQVTAACIWKRDTDRGVSRWGPTFTIFVDWIFSALSHDECLMPTSQPSPATFHFSVGRDLFLCLSLQNSFYTAALLT